MENNKRRKLIEQELLDLPVGRVRVIAFEPTHRWTADTWEIGTWGKKTTTLEQTLCQLMRESHSCSLCTPVSQEVR